MEFPYYHHQVNQLINLCPTPFFSLFLITLKRFILEHLNATTVYNYQFEN